MKNLIHKFFYVEIWHSFICNINHAKFAEKIHESKKFEICDILIGTPKKLSDHYFEADPYLHICDEGIVVWTERMDKYNSFGYIYQYYMNNNFEIVDEAIICQPPFHVSFPTLITANEKEILLESIKSGATKTFNTETKVFTDAYEHPFVDPVIYIHGKLRILIATTPEDPNGKIHVFALNAENQICHKLDVRGGGKRNAGCILQLDKTIRFGQVSNDHYGENIDIFEIVRCDEKTYEEKFISQLLPSYGYIGIHTLNVCGNYITFDLKKRKFDLFASIKKIRFLFCS